MEGRYPKTGYINRPFKLFYLQETAEKDFSYHYHDFHKILIFLGGNVSYAVEGRSYELRPWDIVLVKAGEIHRPIVHDIQPYERVILYLSPDFLDAKNLDGFDLNLIFTTAAATGSSLISVNSAERSTLEFYVAQLKDSLAPGGYAAPLFEKASVLSFMVWLNRILKDGSIRYRDAAASNPHILQILDHINQNLTADLSVDCLAEKFHLNRSYLMHLFKAETGFTILNYVTEKRLFLAKQYIKTGMSVTQACYSCGFSDYTSFYRAFRRRFGVSPKDAHRLL